MSNINVNSTSASTLPVLENNCYLKISQPIGAIELRSKCYACRINLDKYSGIVMRSVDISPDTLFPNKGYVGYKGCFVCQPCFTANCGRGGIQDLARERGLGF